MIASANGGRLLIVGAIFFGMGLGVLVVWVSVWMRGDSAIHRRSAGSPTIDRRTLAVAAGALLACAAVLMIAGALLW